MTPIALILALSAPAQAGPRTAFLEVDNDFAGELELFVNGRYEGLVPGHRRVRFEVKNGRREVRLQRPATAARVVKTTLHFSPGVTSVLQVDAPMTTLQVRNKSPVPLQVDVGPGDGVWIAPTSMVELRVPSGDVTVEARVREAGRVERVRQHTLWAEPGVVNEHVLDYSPTAHTRVSVKNRDHQPLRVVVDGVEIGWLDPGASRVVAVAPGMVTVRFYDVYGRLVTTTDTRATRGDKTVVAARASWSPPPPPRHLRPGPTCDGDRDGRHARR